MNISNDLHLNTAERNTAERKITVQPKPMTQSLETNTELENLGEELGRFKAYDSQLTIPEIKGTRIIKCLYQKNPKTGTKAQENAYVRVATKHLTEEHIVSRIAELSPFILGWLQEQEAIGIREVHKKGGLQVYSGSLTFDSVLERLEASQESARLTKVKIEEWFMAEIHDELAQLFAAKLGFSLDDETLAPESLEKLQLVLNAYKTKFSSLANGKVFIKEADCIALADIIRKCEADSGILGARFIARLGKMQKQEDDLLLAL